MEMDLAAKSAKLQATLKELDSVLVAYSGGTDSAYLAYAAYQALGDKMLAVIADSPSLPRAELAAALAFTAEHNIPTQILQTNELESPDYQRNDARRCFYCKDELFTQMEQTRASEGFAHIAYGRNLDDDGDFRPGQQAATQHHAVAPLVIAQLRKTEIRQLAREANLSLADKPASACLASRIEYGRPVTHENLSQVEQAEAALHALGFRRSAYATMAISPALKSPSKIFRAPSQCRSSKRSPLPSNPSASSTSLSTPKATAPAR